MTNEVLKYKNYDGSIEASLEDGCLFGRILFINDKIFYEGRTLDDLRASFEEAVDEYVVTCEELGKIPEKPCSGQFQVRITSEQHRKTVHAAYEQGTTLNEFVKLAIAERLQETREIRHVHEHRISHTWTEMLPIPEQDETVWQIANPCH